VRGATLIPFTQAAVPSVDLAMRVIRVDRAAAGLVDEDQGDAPRTGPSGGFDPGRRPRGPREAGGNR
jgi:16S rRNA processing protein RimM